MSRSTAARIAAYESWATTPDRAARSATGQRGLVAKFEREARERLGPDATDRQVAQAASAARSAHFARLAAARWGAA
jgi:hypothetical protein